MDKTKKLTKAGELERDILLSLVLLVLKAKRQNIDEPNVMGAITQRSNECACRLSHARAIERAWE